MADINTLLTLCETLEKKGIQPSVAMLRAKSNDTVSLPQAISAINRYKSGEKPVKSTTDGKKLDQEDKSADSVEKRLSVLEQDYQTLQQKITELENQLRQLSNT